MYVSMYVCMYVSEYILGYVRLFRRNSYFISFNFSYCFGIPVATQKRGGLKMAEASLRCMSAWGRHTHSHTHTLSHPHMHIPKCGRIHINFSFAYNPVQYSSITLVTHPLDTESVDLNWFNTYSLNCHCILSSKSQLLHSCNMQCWRC